jgi:hypothetical protein
MYRFDDTQRRRFLEDALVADLLEGALDEPLRQEGHGTGHDVPSAKVAASSAGNVRVAKQGSQAK